MSTNGNGGGREEITPVQPDPRVDPGDVGRNSGPLAALNAAIFETNEKIGALLGEVSVLKTRGEVRHEASERRHETTAANLGLVRTELVRVGDQLALLAGQIHAPRPPLPSLHDGDLDVEGHTENGAPIYRVSASQMQAIRETERRLTAVGEEERIRVAIDKALAAARVRASELADAETGRFVKAQALTGVKWALSSVAAAILAWVVAAATGVLRGRP